MQEVLPGIFHWTALHEKIGIEVSSYYLADAGILLDPMTPAEGVEWFRDNGPPKHILLTNRHHYRHSSVFVDAFDCDVRCHRTGLHEFQHGEQVEPFDFGDTLPGGIVANEVAAICPDETALYFSRAEGVPRAEGVIAFADGVVSWEGGPLRFVPDGLMGDDPAAVKSGLKASFNRLLDLDFDHLLLAHGPPVIGAGKVTLEQFVERTEA